VTPQPWDLRLGDCLEVMQGIESDSIDAMVTDPPYCSGGFSETAKRQAKGQGLRSETIRDVGWFINDNMSSAGLIWLLRTMAVEAYRLLRDGASLTLFTDWRMVPHLAPALESSGLRYQNMLIWDKGNPGLGTGFRPQYEVILHLVKGTGRFHDFSAGNVLRESRVGAAERLHQTEKPVELLQRIVRVVCPTGGLVLDPFMGSGSTGVAAVSEGMRFIGIERALEHVETARRRLSGEEVRPIPGQRSLFGGP